MFNKIVTLHIRIPYCKKNEILIRKYINKIREFTNNNIKITYSWITSKIKASFPTKDKLTNHYNIIYKGICNGNQSYLGEIGRNATTRWKEHERLKGNSEPAKHIAINPEHSFTWILIERALHENKKKKLLEAYHIMINKPSINDQTDIKTLNLKMVLLKCFIFFGLIIMFIYFIYCYHHFLFYH